ncbi:class I SAM-dependent methyltransferase [bacterium]|nr:class I SAM-dependent methyltransferase [bacterium]MBU1880714.1 class I SAM-dependent methyltransferase [bacterium]
MSPDWNQLFRDPTKIIKKPDPLASSFIDALPQGAFVYDLGCGAGRHLLSLTKAGLRVIGSDVARVGLHSSRTWLMQENLAADLFLADMAWGPFRENLFDGVLAMNVINHAKVAEAQQAFDDSFRMLKPDGAFFFKIIGREDARYGEGDQIEPHTFVPRQGIEAGVPHHFYTEEELRQMLLNFNRVEIDKVTRPYDDKDPVFGSDPRLQKLDNVFYQHWAVKAWK